MAKTESAKKTPKKTPSRVRAGRIADHLARTSPLMEDGKVFPQRHQLTNVTVDEMVDGLLPDEARVWSGFQCSIHMRWKFVWKDKYPSVVIYFVARYREVEVVKEFPSFEAALEAVNADSVGYAVIAPGTVQLLQLEMPGVQSHNLPTRGVYLVRFTGDGWPEYIAHFDSEEEAEKAREALTFWESEQEAKKR